MNETFNLETKLNFDKDKFSKKLNYYSMVLKEVFNKNKNIYMNYLDSLGVGFDYKISNTSTFNTTT